MNERCKLIYKFKKLAMVVIITLLFQCAFIALIKIFRSGTSLYHNNYHLLIGITVYSNRVFRKINACLEHIYI